MITIGEARKQGATLLERGGIIAPHLTAEVLLCHALHRERPYLYAHAEQELREVEWIHYGRYLDERLRGKPTQYITRVQEFYGRPFCVSPDVLIPRPETEHLVEAVLGEISEARGIRLVDVGTGSGAIAVTLALESEAEVFATDVSQRAIEMAKRNAQALGAHVRFAQLDFLTGMADGALGAVVSNPPYVPLREAASLPVEVRGWEPRVALFGGDDGLDSYRRLVPESRRVLRPRGLLAIEMGAGEWDAIEELLDGWHAVRAVPDLAGVPRVALARKP